MHYPLCTRLANTWLRTLDDTHTRCSPRTHSLSLSYLCDFFYFECVDLAKYIPVRSSILCTSTWYVQSVVGHESRAVTFEVPRRVRVRLSLPRASLLHSLVTICTSYEYPPEWLRPLCAVCTTSVTPPQLRKSLSDAYKQS